MLNINEIDPSPITNVILGGVGLYVCKQFVVWLRHSIPKSVQCWFCHHKTRVSYSVSNCWHCPNCEQYNGFTKDGGYNKEIKRQFDEKLNFSFTTQGRCRNAWKSGYRLCKQCNHNEELKVKLLAEFVPINERNYDQEIDHYKSQLETCFKLCEKCEKLLYQVLKEERENFSVPRALNACRKVAPSPNFCLILSFILSLSLTVKSYLEMQGVTVPENVYKGINSTFPKLIFLKSNFLKGSNVLLLVGLIFHALSAKQNLSSLPIFNTLSWAVNFFISFYNFDLSGWILPIHAVSGIFSCLISGHKLFNVQHQNGQVQKELKPKLNYKTRPSSPVTSTPSCTPSQSYENLVEESRSEEIKSDFRKEDSLEPRIRGLNIADRSGNFSNYFDEISSNVSYLGAQSVFSNQTKLRKRKSIISPSKFNVSYAPSYQRDIETFSNPPDDCLSCTGHSVQCRQYPSYPSYPFYYPPPVQYFPPVQDSNSKHWTTLYFFPILALFILNAALLYSLTFKSPEPQFSTSNDVEIN